MQISKLLLHVLVADFVSVELVKFKKHLWVCNLHEVQLFHHCMHCCEELFVLLRAMLLDIVFQLGELMLVQEHDQRSLVSALACLVQAKT